MIAVHDLHSTAREYLRAAKLLRPRRSYDAAVYLCGYAVEIALKARICRTLNWTTGFPETGAEFQEKGPLLKTHGLKVLVEYTALQNTIQRNHLTDWSVVLKWSPEQRYNPVGTKSLSDADEMIAATQRLLQVLL